VTGSATVARMPFKLPEYDRVFIGFVDQTVHALARARSPLLADLTVEEGVGPL
jgi:hypothetical protein